MPDRPITASDTSTPSFARPRPVCLEIPIHLHGHSDADSPGSIAETHKAFLEDSKTVLVFARGAVVRLTAGAEPGQHVTLSVRGTTRKVECRVVQSRHYPDARGFIELEFLAPTPGFWGIGFPEDSAPPAPFSTQSTPPPAAVSKPAPAPPAPVKQPALLPVAESLGAPGTLPTPPPPAPFRKPAASPATIAPAPPARPPRAVAPPAPRPAPPPPPRPAISAAQSSALTEPFGSRYSSSESEFAPETEKKSRRTLIILAAVACLLLAIAAGAYFHFSSLPGDAPPHLAFAAPNPADVTPALNDPTTSAPTSSDPAPIPEFHFPSAPTSSSTQTPPPISPNSPAASQITVISEPQPPADSQRKPLPTLRIGAPLASSRSTSENDAPPEISSAQPASLSGANSSLLPAAKSPAVPAPPPSGGVIKPARLLASAPPVYPSLASQNKVAGDVIVEAVVDTSGKVTAAKVLSGPQLLHQAAIDAVKKFRYEPATLNGVPTEIPVRVTVRFRR